MTEDDLKQLLYRRESEALDFKRDQYVFAKGNEDQKAELLTGRWGPGAVGGALLGANGRSHYAEMA